MAAGHIYAPNAYRLLYGLQIAGKYAPQDASSQEKDRDEPVKSLEVTRCGDELAPKAVYCTDDNECDSCDRFGDDCQLQKSQDWRAAHPGCDHNKEDEQDDNSEEEDDTEEDDEDEEDDNASTEEAADANAA